MACTGYEVKFNSGLTTRNIWLDKSTGEQKDFSTYLDLNPDKYIGKTCLHVGTGNSSIARNHHNKFKRIDGISIDPGEVSLANNLMIPNYTCYLINKHKLEELSVLGEYDVIIDNNIKSYMCCGAHYMDYFDWILDSVASRNGEIITHILGYACFFKNTPNSLDNREIDNIAKRVQYTTNQRMYGTELSQIVFIKPINPT